MYLEDISKYFNNFTQKKLNRKFKFYLYMSANKIMLNYVKF